MQRLYKHHAVRAVMGGRWEYTKRLGWYQMERKDGERLPYSVEHHEDNRDIATSIRFIGLIGLLTVVLMAIVLMQAGVL